MLLNFGIITSMKTILNPNIPIHSLNKLFNEAQPFRHVIIDDFFHPDLITEITAEFPKADDDIWFEYNNPIEKKLACDDIRKFPLSIATAIHYLNSTHFLDIAQKITGIAGLHSDPYLHGGGIHCTKKGGKLDMHLDYSIHPKLKLERKLNLIIYLSPNWQASWGGELELWDQSMTECVTKVEIKQNRAVIFETSDISYHGHPDPTSSPEGTTRNSIALYYLTEPSATCLDRPRALFVARPQDDKSEEIEDFRKKRSQVLGIY
jgi:Rps23 Pro-64 3,4-dihydroxylase Tpa1-like proline 4-hydroxylase